MFEDKIYFNEDILDEFEKRGGDREIGDRLLYFMTTEVDDLCRNTDEFVIGLDKLGYLFFEYWGLRYMVERFKKLLEKYDSYQEYVEIAESKSAKYQEIKKNNKIKWGMLCMTFIPKWAIKNKDSE